MLGYEKARQPHYRSYLVRAIQRFAGLHGDMDLEAACEAEIALLRSAVARGGPRVTDKESR